MQKTISTLGLILFFLVAPYSFASSGEISFYGLVTEDTLCRGSDVNNEIRLDCSSNQNGLSETDIVSYSKLEYIDKEKSKAVMHVTYH